MNDNHNACLKIAAANFAEPGGLCVRGFGINLDELPDFTLICTLIAMGFDTPIRILEQAQELRGPQGMLNLADTLKKYTNSPSNVFKLEDDKIRLNSN